MHLKRALTALAAVAAATVAFVVPAQPQTTNTLYVSPNGSDANTCTQAAPCRELNRAMAVAPAGTTISVAAGSYLGFSPTSEQNLVVAGEPGAVIQGGMSSVNTTNLTVRDLTFDHPTGFVLVDSRTSTNTRFERVTIDGGQFRARGTNGFAVTDSAVKNGVALPPNAFCGCGVGAWTYSGVRTANLLVSDSRITNIHGDGVHINSVDGAKVERTIFDGSNADGSGDHVDVIQVIKSFDVELIDNRATNWAHGILPTDYTTRDGPDADNRAMTVTGNVIQTDSGYAWNGPPGANSVISHNVFATRSTANARGVSVTWTIKPDETLTSDGAQFTYNAVRGSLIVTPLITSDWNVATTADGNGDGAHTIYGLE